MSDETALDFPTSAWKLWSINSKRSSYVAAMPTARLVCAFFNLLSRALQIPCTLFPPFFVVLIVFSGLFLDYCSASRICAAIHDHLEADPDPDALPHDVVMIRHSQLKMFLLAL